MDHLPQGLEVLLRAKVPAESNGESLKFSLEKAVIEFPLSEAVGTFGWTFEDIGGSTRITQRCTLDGKQADVYAKAVGPGLGAGVPAGMQKLCGAMEKAARDKSPDA